VLTFAISSIVVGVRHHVGEFGEFHHNMIGSDGHKNHSQRKQDKQCWGGGWWGVV